MFTTDSIHHVQVFSSQFNSFNFLSWPAISSTSRLKRVRNIIEKSAVRNAEQLSGDIILKLIPVIPQPAINEASGLIKVRAILTKNVMRSIERLSRPFT